MSWTTVTSPISAQMAFTAGLAQVGLVGSTPCLYVTCLKSLLPCPLQSAPSLFTAGTRSLVLRVALLDLTHWALVALIVPAPFPVNALVRRRGQSGSGSDGLCGAASREGSGTASLPRVWDVSEPRLSDVRADQSPVKSPQALLAPDGWSSHGVPDPRSSPDQVWLQSCWRGRAFQQPPGAT